MTTLDEKLNTLKNEYGFSFSESLVTEAINYARTELLHKAFEKVKKEQVITDSNNNLFIDNYVADSNFDYVVTKDDIEIVEYSVQNNVFNTNNLSSHISSVVFDYPTGKTIIKMDGQYPASGYILQITYYKIKDVYANILNDVKDLETAFAYFYLIRLLDKYKMQRGITNPGINSLNIQYDRNAIVKLKEDLLAEINSIIMRVRPLYINEININKRY